MQENAAVTGAKCIESREHWQPGHRAIAGAKIQYSPSSSFHVIDDYLLTVFHGLAVFKTKSTLSSREKRCNDIRPLARSAGVKQIYFVSNMKFRSL